MRLDHPRKVPEGTIWSAEDIPPKCDPMCGVSLHPVQFVVVWHALFALDQKRINPWTNQPEERHILIGQELWYFMTANGCWSAAPSGALGQPHARPGGTVVVKPKFAKSHQDRWKLMAQSYYMHGALPPRSVHPLEVFQKLIPLPYHWFS